MGSSRLPGKVLEPLAGQPVLALLLARLQPLADARLVVATSDLPQDDPVVELARAQGVAVVRGSEADVLSRFLVALEAFPAQEVVRLTADCPFLDAALVHAVRSVHHELGVDYTSNTLQRTFPDGLDVEVIAADALRAAAVEASDPDEREHVTPFVYRRPDRFRVASVELAEPLGHERWTLDSADDLADLQAMAARLDDPVTASWQDVLRATGRREPAGTLPPPPEVRFAAHHVLPASVALIGEGPSPTGTP
jgi:spore coat polysaccharide biosynthesis protein SpsF